MRTAKKAASRPKSIRVPQAPDMMEVVKFLEEHNDVLVEYEHYRSRLAPFGATFRTRRDKIRLRLKAK